MIKEQENYKFDNESLDQYIIDDLEGVDKIVNIQIFFVRKSMNVKILIENWTLKFVHDKGGGSCKNEKKYRKILMLKKLSTFIRTVHSYTRLLPAYTFCNCAGFDYKLDYKIYCTKNEQNISSGLSEDFLKICKSFKNNCDIHVGVFILHVEYMMKNEIYITEQAIVNLFSNNNYNTN